MATDNDKLLGDCGVKQQQYKGCDTLMDSNNIELSFVHKSPDHRELNLPGNNYGGGSDNVKLQLTTKFISSIFEPTIQMRFVTLDVRCENYHLRHQFSCFAFSSKTCVYYVIKV